MRSLRLVSWMVGVVLLSGCAPLDAIERGVCGNHVVEPGNGEDCDADVAGEGGFHCVACRYECKPDSDPDDAIDDRCPDGFSCGSDQVCRRRTGRFGSPELLVGGQAYRLESGDFNNDGFTDLLSVTRSQTSVHYLSYGGSYSSSYEAFAHPSPFALGDFSKDDYLDLAVAGEAGISMLRGHSDRRLDPTVYEGAETPLVVAVAAADALDLVPGDELLRARIELDTVPPRVVVTGWSYSDPFLQHELFTLDGDEYQELAGEPVAARLSPGDRCDSLVLAFQGRPDLQVFQTCGDGTSWNTDPTSMKNVTLVADQVIWSGALAGDLDGDGDLDLVVGATGAAGAHAEIFIYDGVDFAMQAMVPVVEDYTTVCYGSEAERSQLLGPPLALGDMDGDGIADLVDEAGVLYVKPGGLLRAPCVFPLSLSDSPEGWTDAVVGHFNQDPFSDFAVSSRGARRIDVHLGRGDGSFSSFSYEVSLGVAQILAADLDGDVIGDLVVWQDGTGRDGDLVSVIFGSIAGPPEQPVDLGHLGNVQQIVSGTTIGRDGLDDLVVLSGFAQGAFLSYLPGDLGRRIQSPIILNRQSDEPEPKPRLSIPTRMVAGNFDGAKGAELMVQAIEAEFILPDGGPSPGGDIQYQAESVVWRLKDLDQSSVGREPLKSFGSDPASFLRGMNVVAVDLEEPAASSGGAGVADRDELVVFNGTEGTAITVGIWRFGADATITEETRVEDEPVIDVGSFLLLLPMAEQPDPAMPSFDVQPPLRVADVDSDGLRDIALTTASGEVVVLWNHNGFDGEELSVYAIPEVDLENSLGFPIRDLVFLNLDRDEELELAVVTSKGVELFDLAHEEGSPRREWELVGLGSIDTDGGSRSLAAFDADLDGLTDLIVGRESGVHLLRAQ